MADKKITQLNNITGANLVDADEFVVVDISADETKAITLGELKEAFDAGSGFVRVTGDTMTGDLSFGDNDKAIFGAGSDLQIYHSGSDSIIKDGGTGDLQIRAANFKLNNAEYTTTMLEAYVGGPVSLWYNNSAKLSTTATGIDVTGTVTADGLTVDGNILASGLNPFIRLVETDQTDKNAYIRTYDGVFSIGTENTAQTVRKQRLRIDHSTGDISFYEDTGTTPKFFWDASAESLGIGTSSPARLAEIYGTTNPALRLNNGTANVDIGIATAAGALLSGSSANDLVIARNGAYNIKLGTNGTTRMTLDSSGNVGIGTSSPASQVHLAGGVNGTLRVDTTASGYLDLSMYSNGGFIATSAAQPLRFGVSNAERMRIDSSGNLLVGRTSNNWPTAAGFTAQSNGAIIASRADASGYFNRLSTDGSIVNFSKDGSTVGSIGSVSGLVSYINLDPRSGGTGIGGTNTNCIMPTTGTGAGADGTKDLGLSAVRWRDLYLSGGVYLGGTGAANKLDDYEEGTWTATVSGESNVSSTSVVAARYTKIGRIVTCILDMDTTVTNSSSEARFAIALPFTAHIGAHYDLGVASIILGAGSNRSGVGVITHLSSIATLTHVVFAANQLAQSGAAGWVRATFTYEAA